MLLPVRRGAFSTGFAFEYYDGDEDEMGVKPVRKTLKEEIVESGHLSPAEWMEFVELKASKYMKSKRIKWKRSRGYTELAKRTPVTKEHIFAIILYCDFSKLCTAFSATFRQQNVFETMESVKQRHSHFAVFGRLLVELVWEFGVDGTERRGNEKGPFFCGLNCVLNIGSFAITLKGPCSTSTQREVAVNFAKSNGIILKLDNDTDGGSLQQCFDCSWISNYFEEAERLWIAGRTHLPLRIVSIVIVKNAKNYRKMMRALFLFDAMTSGVELGKESKIKPEAADYELLRKLIDSELNGGIDVVAEFDEYVKREWKLFLQSKEKVELNFRYIWNDFKILSKLVVYDLVEYKEDEAAKGNVNIFKAEWIFLFPAVNSVSISTWSGNGDGYKCRLEGLLESMKVLPRSVGSVTVYTSNRPFRWAQEGLTNEVKSSFAECGWNAEYPDGEDGLVFTLKTD